MKKLHYSIFINAPKEKVWNTMLDKETYEQWTKIFNPSNSTYEGEWTEGSDIRFIGPNENGKVSGMISKVKELRPYEYVSIQHLGEIIENEEKLWTKEEQPGEGFFENYTFTDKDGGTELSIELDIMDEFADMMDEMWPLALEKLKEISEK
jgi:uncharacterized protein YndB with AHSA1/START domain